MRSLSNIIRDNAAIPGAETPAGVTAQPEPVSPEWYTVPTQSASSAAKIMRQFEANGFTCHFTAETLNTGRQLYWVAFQGLPSSVEATEAAIRAAIDDCNDNKATSTPMDRKRVKALTNDRLAQLFPVKSNAG